MEVMEEEIKATHVSPCTNPVEEVPVKKVGSRDIKKPTSFKDWNTPWIRRDGKGLKKIFRSLDGTTPVRTSHNHFYSEPHSLLGPEPEPIPLERIEEMREAIARSHELERRQEHHHRQQQQQQQQQSYQQEDMHTQRDHRVESQDTSRINRLEEENYAQVHQESEVCEESEPPELEEILENTAPGSAPHLIPQHISEDKPLYDLQEEEPAALTESNQELPKTAKEEVVSQETRNLLDLESLKKSMEKFTNISGYEPSADELIQVLKNLENLAASNTPMYMALVQLIQANQSKEFNDNMNDLMNGEAGILSGSSLDAPERSQEEQTESNGFAVNGSCVEEEEEKEEVNQKENQDERMMEKEELTQPAPLEDRPVGNDTCNPEETKKHNDEDIMERIATKKQEVRRRVHAEPRKIRVVAGSQHRASWPCAPSVANTTAPKVVEVILGETEEDSFKNRRDVAEKAGLKHIDVILGDESFYPQLFEDFDYPWKGSLRPVSDSLNRHGKEDLDLDSVPWASSLRHVPESQKRKKASKSSSSAAAPWIGTLRHVKSVNNQPKTFTKPQFKRYPDEDAPNPFQGLSGKDARPAYPLTPAAQLNSSSNSEAFADANEDVDRIRSNLRETRAISNTLLRVLMPKLLKEHESKYEPLSFEESQKIMNEILSQKIGMGDTQGLNDEDLTKEIDESFLGKVEEDLKAAMSSKKKEGKAKGKKKKKVTSASSSKKLEVSPLGQ